MEVTIINYQGQILLSTVVTPRQYVPFNENHAGFPEEEMMQGKDEVSLRDYPKTRNGKGDSVLRSNKHISNLWYLYQPSPWIRGFRKFRTPIVV